MIGGRKHIGRLLESARKIRRLKADDVAQRCNVNRSNYYKWEKQAFILPKNLPLLSGALKVPLTVLLSENGSRHLKKVLDV